MSHMTDSTAMNTGCSDEKKIPLRLKEPNHVLPKVVLKREMHTLVIQKVK